MKDFFGQELNIGDTVAVLAKGYRRLVEAEVVAFTPKSIRVKYFNSWHYATPKEKIYLVCSDMVVKKV